MGDIRYSIEDYNPGWMVITKQGASKPWWLPHGDEASIWEEVGAKSLLKRVRERRPQRVVIIVPDLHFYFRPLLCNLALKCASPTSRITIIDEAGDVEEVTFGRILTRDVFCAIAGGVLAIYALLRLLVSIRASLASCKPSRALTGPANKVLLVRPHFFHAKFGGTLSHLRGVVAGFHDNGIETMLVCTDRLEIELEECPVIRVLPNRLLRDYPRAMELWSNYGLKKEIERHYRKHGCDMIYQRHHGSIVAGAWAAKACDAPFVLEFNSSDSLREQLWGERKRKLAFLGHACERYSLLSASLVIAVSNVLKAQIAEAWGNGPRVEVLSNGVDADKFAPVNVDSKGSIFRVGFAGSLMPYMGLTELIKAFVQFYNSKAWAQRYESAELHIWGEGGLKSELIRQAAAASDGSSHINIHGAVSPDEIPELLAGCHVLASPHNPGIDPSLFYWSPLKVFEYMSCGAGIIASEIGQIAEVLSDGSNALLVSPGNVGDLALAMERLAVDRSLLSTISQQARLDVTANYTWGSQMQVLLQWLRREQGTAPH